MIKEEKKSSEVPRKFDCRKKVMKNTNVIICIPIHVQVYSSLLTR